MNRSTPKRDFGGQNPFLYQICAPFILNLNILMNRRQGFIATKPSVLIKRPIKLNILQIRLTPPIKQVVYHSDTANFFKNIVSLSQVQYHTALFQTKQIAASTFVFLNSVHCHGELTFT